MDFFRNFPAFSILLSLLCAVFCAVLRPRAARWTAIALIVTGCLLSAGTLYLVSSTGTAFTYTMGHFPAPWGNELRAGILEAALAVAFGLVLLLSVLGGLPHLYKDVEETKSNLYFVMICLIQAGLLALIYTNDLFTAYVFLEISTLASCGLLMIRQIGRTTLAAIRYMIFNLLGSGLFLIGLTLLYDSTGHLLMSSTHEALAPLLLSGEANVLLLITLTLIAMGLSIKSGLFPFHFWMPDTYGYATTISSAILSGLVSKGYILLLIKIFLRVIGWEAVISSGLLNVLFVFGLCGILVGSLSAIRENNINRMIAFSSAAQIGYIYVGIGLGTAAGLTAALFHILTHAFTKPLLFTAAARLSDVSGGSKRFADLQGAGHRNRVAGLAFTIGALSMVGLPFFSGFISKVLFSTAALGGGAKMLPTLIVLAVSTVLNALYFLRTVIRIYTPAPADAPVYETAPFRKQKIFALTAVCFILLNMGLGMLSQPIVRLLEAGLKLFT